MTTLGRHPDALAVKLTLGDGAHLVASTVNGWAGPVTLHYGPKTGAPVISDPGTVDGDEVSWTLTEAEATARAEHDWARLEDNGVTIAAGPVMTWLGGSGHTATQTIASLTAGPPGPTAVSADPDNVATLGSDGLIYVSPADAGGFSDAAVAAFVDDTGSSTYASILAGFAATDDPRLSDARTPTAHEHTAADVDSGASSDGQVLTSDGAGGAAWETPASGVTDHGLLSGLGDDDHTQYALADGSRGAFAPPLGVDDNYVTDAEKTKLDNLSGTNTGDQDLTPYATTASLADYLTVATFLDALVEDPDNPGLYLVASLNIDVLDSFDRADGALGAADTGETWTVDTGTWAITSNKATCTTVVGQHRAWVPFSDPDLLVSVDLDGGVMAGGHPGVIARFTDVNNYYLFRAQNSATAVACYAWADGSLATLQGQLFVGSPIESLALSLQEVEGVTVVIGYVNGAQVFSTTDTRPARPMAGGCGLYSYRIGGATPPLFDNFAVTRP